MSDYDPTRYHQGARSSGPGDQSYITRPGRQNPLKLRISKKGCVSVYGLRRFPISLYADEWETILAAASKITEFITAHPELTRK